MPHTPRRDLLGQTRADVARHAQTIGSPAHLAHMAHGLKVWAGALTAAALVLAATGHQLPHLWPGWILASTAGLALWMWVSEVATAGEHGRALPGLRLARTVMLVLLVVLTVGVALLFVAAFGGPAVIR